MIKVQSKLTFGLGALLLQGVNLDTLSKFRAHLETLSALIPKRKSIKLKIITRLLDIYFSNNLFWKKKYNLVDAIRRLVDFSYGSRSDVGYYRRIFADVIVYIFAH